MPHGDALHHAFGMGIAEIRTDTYLLSPRQPHWRFIIRGATELEIKEKAGDQAPVSAWNTPQHSFFPLRRGIVRLLQDAFPEADLPRQISGPADLISWLGRSGSVCSLNKRIVHFQRGSCAAELAHVAVQGRSVETLCLRARRYDDVLDALQRIPGPRLPNLDFGAWLERHMVPAATQAQLSR
jgi:hypothetical protein